MFFMLHRHTTSPQDLLKCSRDILWRNLQKLSSFSFQRFMKMTNSGTLEPEA
ncbi:unnamed protein product [Arabidopsis thaliana]|uniref:(thale cress) hypothetical protein n=1 Tax=Arabidopsis thaliana TaxID=3702 RepID=A0A178ULF2_ARATH|nr:hypothetical protein AXX17_AT5G03350 [Arabidopsis thaliana]CAD5330754.1 unnamed protein product [Arabidopsis thaliana]